MKVALAQTHILWENKQSNFEKAASFITQAREAEADIVFFPEMSLTGFSMNIQITAEGESQETVEKIRELCIKEAIAVGIGWAKRGEEKAENHYTVVDARGNICSDYVKIHPFSCAGESKVFLGGSEIVYYKLGDYTWSTLICYDLRFPEVFQIASRNADIIVVPANWPQNREDHWRTLLKARAIENQSYIFGVNCVGQVGELMYSGLTSAYSPEGQCLKELSDEEGIIIVELNRSDLDIRKSFPVKRDRKWQFYSHEYMKKASKNFKKERE